MRSPPARVRSFSTTSRAPSSSACSPRRKAPRDTARAWLPSSSGTPRSTGWTRCCPTERNYSRSDQHRSPATRFMRYMMTWRCGGAPGSAPAAGTSAATRGSASSCRDQPARRQRRQALMGQLGVQLTPWTDSRQLVGLARRLSDVADIMWVQDQMLARNVYALLGAIAYAGCGVGTNVTYPTGRNPIEMASALATIAELAADDRELLVGLGTGGALVDSLFRKDRPVAAARESIQLMRALWSGARVAL